LYALVFNILITTNVSWSQEVTMRMYTHTHTSLFIPNTVSSLGPLHSLSGRSEIQFILSAYIIVLWRMHYNTYTHVYTLFFLFYRRRLYNMCSRHTHTHTTPTSFCPTERPGPRRMLRCRLAVAWGQTGFWYTRAGRQRSQVSASFSLSLWSVHLSPKNPLGILHYTYIMYRTITIMSSCCIQSETESCARKCKRWHRNFVFSFNPYTTETGGLFFRNPTLCKPRRIYHVYQWVATCNFIIG